MSESEKRVVLEAAEVKRLIWEYRQMKDIVACYVFSLWAAADLPAQKYKPEELEQLQQKWQKWEAAMDAINSQMNGFKRVLETTFQLQKRMTVRKRTRRKRPKGN